jgi:hypothetical protein
MGEENRWKKLAAVAKEVWDAPELAQERNVIEAAFASALTKAEGVVKRVLSKDEGVDDATEADAPAPETPRNTGRPPPPPNASTEWLKAHGYRINDSTGRYE